MLFAAREGWRWSGARNRIWSNAASGYSIAIAYGFTGTVRINFSGVVIYFYKFTVLDCNAIISLRRSFVVKQTI